VTGPQCGPGGTILLEADSIASGRVRGAFSGIRPPDGDREHVLAAEIHGRDDVADIRASSDEQRVFVDHGVVEFSRLFVFRMVAPDNRAAKSLSEFRNDFPSSIMFLPRIAKLAA
jgi:hypothetical protein